MEEYIRKITEQMRCVRAREYVAKELTDHILDQAEAYEERGTGHEEAIVRAVREMGDPVEIGMELDRIHRPQTDYKMIGMAFLFSFLGLLVLYTAGGLSGAPIELFRQCLCILLSFGVMAGMYFLDYGFVGRYAYAVYIAMTFLFCAARGFRTMAGNMGRNPAMLMFVYLYIPVYAGILYRMRGKGYGGVGKCAALQILTAAFAYVFSGTFHTAAAVYGMCMLLLLCAIVKGWFGVHRKVAVMAVLGALVGAPVLFIVVNLGIGAGNTLMSVRLAAYLNPAKHAKDAGYIYGYIREQLSAALWVGSSEAGAFMETNSMAGPYIYRTEPFILLELVCKYGWLAGGLAVFALGAVVVRAFRIVMRQKNRLGFILSAACFMILLVNCLEGILINTGYYPVTSMQLPFVSYGVGASVTYGTLIGLLLSIYRNEKIMVGEAGNPFYSRLRQKKLLP